MVDELDILSNEMFRMVNLPESTAELMDEIVRFEEQLRSMGDPSESWSANRRATYSMTKSTLASKRYRLHDRNERTMRRNVNVLEGL